MSEFKKQLKEYEYLVIPTANVANMFQDVMGFVYVKVGIGPKATDSDHMLFFINHDSFHRLGGDDEND